MLYQPAPINPNGVTNPRKRLSLYTHATLPHDLSQALKASTPRTPEDIAKEDIPAPPPSPVDFGTTQRSSYFDLSARSESSSVSTSRSTSSDTLYQLRNGVKDDEA